ncbi:styrene monooxygenase/indole monooxygenase family protein [Myxococcus qinghaiensis]|uniref:styrene monooxygenase/indole monooxygenase family protein n=1 Tax=Myxococcus qinghaiensis TaxID=2906758 RepID=UPI0020A73FA4|nr:styrene monooxygenase/indole monooxygenase family protein [Myxococcus qinghaiensis]MCP3167987.1 monooxygenase [Myxococcus qinghaiensis]
MASIGIVGAGTAGLHLGLKLLSQGIPVTLYAEQEPDALRVGRLLNTVTHHAPTRARERELYVDFWGAPELAMNRCAIHVHGPHPFSLKGRVSEPSLCVDYRLYQPRLAEAFVERGGRLEVMPVDLAALEGLTRRHALVVVATGRSGLNTLFPRVPELSPHDKPPRVLFAAMLKGLRMPEPFGMHVNLVPGQGEVFESQIITRHGRVPSTLIEAVPGSELASMISRKRDDDPAGFDKMLLELMRRHAPATYERIDPTEFGVRGPLDFLQGGFTPMVRRAWAQVGEGRFVMTVGDTHVTNDPIAGQGANAASASAFTLAIAIQDALLSERPFDERFCRDTETRMWAAVAPATDWTNALLQPPPPHVIDLLVAGSRDNRVADAIVSAFMIPERILGACASPEAAAEFIAHAGTPSAEILAASGALGWDTGARIRPLAG